VDILSCSVMAYPWGSRTALAELLGTPSPSPGPQAELWMGAHPNAPSLLAREGMRAALSEVIAQSPEQELGETVLRTFGPRLPFLLKVLAAAEPLSLQAHPTQEQAKLGFEREEALGIPRTAAERTYRDPFHKPELLCALTPFDALSGFRAIGETLRLFEMLAVRELEEVLAPLRMEPSPERLAIAFQALMTMPRDVSAKAVEAMIQACRRDHPMFARERQLALRLAALYPGDIGVVSALFLEFVHLQPGEAIYLGPRNLHAYVEGTGIEIMASSDNVIRGGLTQKHVDVSALLETLDFHAPPPTRLRGRALDPHEIVYDTPAREFRLSRLEVRGSLRRRVHGPEILLTTEGIVHTEGVSAPKGTAWFVPAARGSYILSGEGTVFRATTNTET
jgi:mannose-6-phosphate isomerase